jgi:hypothetical protein
MFLKRAILSTKEKEMNDINLERVRELVEARFDEAHVGAAASGSYSLRLPLPEGPLTERQKKAVYSSVIAFADQLKRQIGKDMLLWLMLPSLRFVGNRYSPPKDIYELHLCVSSLK